MHVLGNHTEELETQLMRDLVLCDTADHVLPVFPLVPPACFFFGIVSGHISAILFPESGNDGGAIV